MGFTSGCFSPTEIIYENNKLNDFQIFLKENGLDYELGFESENGKHVLYAYFNGKKSKILFSSIVSTGIQTLMLFYAWSIKAFSAISFLFIDDFDVFLHYESAERLVRILNGYSKFQSVLTMHNANLMRNNLIRPDCCFLMTQNKLTNLFGSTKWKIKGQLISIFSGLHKKNIPCVFRRRGLLRSSALGCCFRFYDFIIGNGDWSEIVEVAEFEENVDVRVLSRVGVTAIGKPSK